MSGIKMSIDGIPALEKELQRLNSIRFDAVITKNITQMFNRGKGTNTAMGGTPVSTEETRPGGPHGELRGSLTKEKDEVGYTKEYAPHVEYGHRTKNGGWVSGQRFLQNNVEIQRPGYRQDLIDAIRKG